MTLLESGEMYLETILILSRESGFVRAVDIGDYMGYSKPSVSRAMGLLKGDGYITVSKDGGIELTEKGRLIAEKIYSRHTKLTEFFKTLGVDSETATDDACRIEHVISDKTFNALCKHLDEMRR